MPSPVLASTVLDTEGRDFSTSPGTPGEAVYRSPSMMSGYYRDEAVTAVVRSPGDTTTEAELIAHCRAALAGYETPKSVVFADALPETVGGKVLKYRLRSMHAAHYDGSEALR